MNKKIISGGNAFTQCEITISSGNASTQIVDKVIKSGSALSEVLGGNKKIINGGNAFTQYEIAINGGNASTQIVDKIIKGGSASSEKIDKWLKERKEVRRFKRMVRHAFANRSSFEIDLELMSYDTIPKQPILRQNYLKKLVQTGKRSL